ncbi:MAG: hypothetical protein PW843_03435 [Azospirillaceae bacterium]|nr:hypothetical protein [Azospirillaceae bacterium]
MMTLTEFEDLVDLHGPDPALWPVVVRPQAVALLAQSAEARQALATGRLAEDALSTMPLDRASPNLRRAILAIPETTRHPAAWPVASPAPVMSSHVQVVGGRGIRGLWTGGMSAALASGMAAAVVGIVLGVHGVSPLSVQQTDASSPATIEYMKAMTEIDTEMGQ